MPPTVDSIINNGLSPAFYLLSPSKMNWSRFIRLVDAVEEIRSLYGTYVSVLIVDSESVICSDTQNPKTGCEKLILRGCKTTFPSYRENVHWFVVIAHEVGGGYHVFASGIPNCFRKHFKTRQFDTKPIDRMPFEFWQRWRAEIGNDVWVCAPSLQLAISFNSWKNRNSATEAGVWSLSCAT